MENQKPKQISYSNLSLRRAPEGKFKVLGFEMRKLWDYGDYASYKDAKAVVDDHTSDLVRLYVCNDVGRVLYPSAK
jgi:hypothetical protein